jgi:hypothetical protein
MLNDVIEVSEEYAAIRVAKAGIKDPESLGFLDFALEMQVPLKCR